MQAPQSAPERRALIEELLNSPLWKADPEGFPHFQACCHWWVEWTDPRTERPDLLHPERNLLMMIHLEATPQTGSAEPYHVAGYSLEDCLVDLALLVNRPATQGPSAPGSP